MLLTVKPTGLSVTILLCTRQITYILLFIENYFLTFKWMHRPTHCSVVQKFVSHILADTVLCGNLSPCFVPICYVPFCFDTSCQFTPLSNLCSVIFSLIPFGWLFSIKPLVSDGNNIFDLCLFIPTFSGTKFRHKTRAGVFHMNHMD